MNSLREALRGLLFTIRLNSDRILYVATVIVALGIGAFVGAFLIKL